MDDIEKYIVLCINLHDEFAIVKRLWNDDVEYYYVKSDYSPFIYSKINKEELIVFAHLCEVQPIDEIKKNTRDEINEYLHTLFTKYEELKLEYKNKETKKE